jgi:SAM-dependent methyltransferase
MTRPDEEPAAPEPAAILTWGARKLEHRAPRLVRALRRTRDRSVGWRDSYAYRHYPDPGKPYGARYWRNHRRFVAAALGDEAVLDRFRSGEALPPGYGVGLDERVVEFPWLLARAPEGRVLDAGSALNHRHVLDRVLPSVGELSICTLAPEERSYPERGVSYVYADLRQLPFRSNWFDAVVSLSTLEHVGMEVARWGADAPVARDPDSELARAVGELRRTTRQGGRLFLTVPYGRREDHGWLRQFDREDVERLVATAAPATFDITVFAYDRRGWRLSALEDAADARYQAGNRPAADPHTADLAPAARAVACLEATV